MLFYEYKPNRVSQVGKVQVIIWKKIIAVIDTTFAVAKGKPEKNSDLLSLILHPAVLIYDFHIFITSRNK